MVEQFPEWIAYRPVVLMAVAAIVGALLLIIAVKLTFDIDVKRFMAVLLKELEHARRGRRDVRSFNLYGLITITAVALFLIVGGWLGVLGHLFLYALGYEDVPGGAAGLTGFYFLTIVGFAAFSMIAVVISKSD